MLEGVFPAGFTLWNFLDSQFLNTVSSALVAIAVAFVGGKVTLSIQDAAAQEGALSASQQAQNIEAAGEQAGEAPEASPQENDRRPQAKAAVDAAKEFLDTKAEKSEDGRHRRTYEALNRYDYIPLAVALNVRKEINAGQLAAAASLFSLWKQYERGHASRKRVPQSVADKLSGYLSALKKVN
jgi:hypothetical protein